MTAHFTYKVGDTAPAFRIQLLQATGAPQDLTGAAATLRVRRPGASAFVTLGALTVEGGTEGWVNRPWVAGDIDRAGLWDADVPVVFAGGAKQTYPGHGYIRFNVSD